MYLIIIVLLAYAIWVGWNDHNNNGNSVLNV